MPVTLLLKINKFLINEVYTVLTYRFLLLLPTVYDGHLHVWLKEYAILHFKLSVRLNTICGLGRINSS